MTKLERELIEEKFSGMNARIEANFDVVHDSLKQIVTQQKIANNRTTKLERQTEVVRFFTKYPKLFVIFLVALFGSIYHNDIWNIILKIIS